MMRHAAFVLALALTCTSALTAQQKKSKAAAKTVSLSGCIATSEKSPEQYTLADANAGTFRLTGVNLKEYLGRPVQIAGAIVETKRLTIKGGLTPNPNAAAQAGAMDPARAAVASAGGSAGPGTVDLPEFKVKSVRPGSGTCPD
jgi:hypothetical protein